MYPARLNPTPRGATTMPAIDLDLATQLEQLLDRQGWTTVVEEHGTDVKVTWFIIEQANCFLRAAAQFVTGPNLYHAILGSDANSLRDPANAGPHDWRYYLEPEDVVFPEDALDDVLNICLVAHILIPRDQTPLVVRRLLATQRAACPNEG